MPTPTGNLCPRANEVGDLGVTSLQWGKAIAKARCINMTAGAILSGHRIVTTSGGNVIYADAGTVAHAGKILGMSIQSAIMGADLLIQIEGECVEPGWAWTPGARLYLGSSGAISETAPTSGFICPIGWAETATKIAVQIGASIVLA
jgi:hypothetical protein